MPVFLDEIRATASQLDTKQNPVCPFCREVIAFSSEHYSLSSLNNSQQREIEELQVAIDSRSTIDGSQVLNTLELRLHYQAYKYLTHQRCFTLQEAFQQLFTEITLKPSTKT